MYSILDIRMEGKQETGLQNDLQTQTIESNTSTVSHHNNTDPNNSTEATPSTLNNVATYITNNISTDTAKIGMLGIGVGSLFGGIAMGMKNAANKDEKAYQEALKHEPIHKFARRALVRGTQYAIGGFSLFCVTVWLGMGQPTLKEFTHTMQQTLPNPKKSNLQEWQLGWGSQKKEDTDDDKKLVENLFGKSK